MNRSLNEIEATAKRASRGAGLSWGMAEEAAKACRWLASHDLPAVAVLADVLTQNDGVSHRQVAPLSLDGVWAAASGVLCPLASGATLNDCADRLLVDQTIEMRDLFYPLLVVPFAAWAAFYINTPVCVSWSGTHIVTDGQRIWIDDPNSQIDTVAARTLTCSRTTSIDGRASEPKLRATVSQQAWARLTAFSDRTYVPATDASRQFGAGTGVSDND